jgi:hypothetical protein
VCEEKSYDHCKAWSSINLLILTDATNTFSGENCTVLGI